LLEIWRMRLFLVLLALCVLFCTLGLAAWAAGGTNFPDQKIQTMLSYSLGSISVLLALTTIFITTASITRDIKRREIFTIATKPIRRSEILLGKIVGIGVYNLILLIIAGVLIYGMVYWMEHILPRNQAERDRVRDFALVARQSVKPVMPDVTAWVEERLEILAQEEQRRSEMIDPIQIQAMREKMRKELTNQATMMQRTAPPGGAVLFHFQDIRPVDPDSRVVIRYKQSVSQNPVDDNLDNYWRVGPEDPSVKGGTPLVTRGAQRTVHEITLPTSMVSPAGDLYVVYGNPPSNSRQYLVSVIFPVKDGIEVFYAVGEFETNFLRCLGVMYLRVMLLAVLSAAVGAWVSYPVAILAMLVFYFLGLMSSFISSAVDWWNNPVLVLFIRTVIFFLPTYSAYDPIALIERGRLVSWPVIDSLGTVFASLGSDRKIPEDAWENIMIIKDICLTIAAGFIGYLIFRFRELARVIV
ncbi:MAG: ABC transporter permease, partial [Sedimentisphaerales bacterium]|nr:ABC transporter permease [Sedimentisphaerales bacterium]